METPLAGYRTAVNQLKKVRFHLGSGINGNTVIPSVRSPIAEITAVRFHLGSGINGNAPSAVSLAVLSREERPLSSRKWN